MNARQSRNVRHDVGGVTREGRGAVRAGTRSHPPGNGEPQGRAPVTPFLLLKPRRRRRNQPQTVSHLPTPHSVMLFLFIHTSVGSFSKVPNIQLRLFLNFAYQTFLGNNQSIQQERRQHHHLFDATRHLENKQTARTQQPKLWHSKIKALRVVQTRLVFYEETTPGCGGGMQRKRS